MLQFSGDQKFGKRTFNIKGEHDSWNFMRHDDGGSRAWNVEAAGEGKGVKFGSGEAWLLLLC